MSSNPAVARAGTPPRDGRIEHLNQMPVGLAAEEGLSPTGLSSRRPDVPNGSPRSTSPRRLKSLQKAVLARRLQNDGVGVGVDVDEVQVEEAQPPPPSDLSSATADGEESGSEEHATKVVAAEQPSNASVVAAAAAVAAAHGAAAAAGLEEREKAIGTVPGSRHGTTTGKKPNAAAVAWAKVGWAGWAGAGWADWAQEHCERLHGFCRDPTALELVFYESFNSTQRKYIHQQVRSMVHRTRVVTVAAGLEVQQLSRLTTWSAAALGWL